MALRWVLYVPRVWTAVRWRCGGCCTYHGFGQQCDGVPVCTTTSTERTTGLDSSAMALRWVLYVPRVWTAVRWRCCGCCTYLGFGQQCNGVPVCVVLVLHDAVGLRGVGQDAAVLRALVPHRLGQRFGRRPSPPLLELLAKLAVRLLLVIQHLHRLQTQIAV